MGLHDLQREEMELARERDGLLFMTPVWDRRLRTGSWVEEQICWKCGKAKEWGFMNECQVCPSLVFSI